MKQHEESFRSRLLGTWGRWASTRFGAALLIALGVTVVVGIGITRLQLNLTFYSILPDGSPKVRDLKVIEETFPAATSMIVVLDALPASQPAFATAGTASGTSLGAAGEDREATAEQRVTAAVDAVVDELSGAEYDEHIAQVFGRVPLEFYQDHGLLLMEETDIDRMADMFSALDLTSLFKGINDDFETVYVGDEARTVEDETELVGQIEGIGRLLQLMAAAAQGTAPTDAEAEDAVDRLLFGDQYVLSADRTKALVYVQPTFGMDDFQIYVDFIPRMEHALQDRVAELGVDAGLTGLLVVAKDEFVTSEQGLALSMTLAIVLILVLLIISFRMFSVPLIAGVPLLVGIIWTVGLTGYFVQRLNIMTAMYLVALVGLGVDYAIHMLTTFVQERDDGCEFHDAVARAMSKSGAGIVTGAVTTAVAFIALVVAESAMVKELGVVAGMGIIAEAAAMFVIVPALLGAREHRRRRKGKNIDGLLERIGVKWRVMGRLGSAVQRRPVFFIIFALVAGIALSTQAPRVEVEGNLMNMEAKGLESVELQDTMVEDFGMAPDTLSVLAGSLADARTLTDRIEDLPTVDQVESLSLFVPAEEVQQRKLAAIDRFRSVVENASGDGSGDGSGGRQIAGRGFYALSDQLARLQMNLLELSSIAYMSNLPDLLSALTRITGWGVNGQKNATTPMDVLLSLEGAGALPELQSTVSPLLRSKLIRMTETGTIGEEDVPRMFLDSYRSVDGSSYLVNIIPEGNPWEADFRSALTEDVETVTDRATGMVLAADQMTRIAETDGLRAALVALAVILVVLLIDFRDVRLAVLALLPLLLSFGSLFGIMALTGIKFDFINIIAVPLLIGIGIDDAVHVNHRYVLEGPGSISRVVSRTGRAILLTSLTTIIGFVSFVPSPMRAMRSTGIVLSLAMALAFIYSLTFHPALLSVVFDRSSSRTERRNA